MWVYTDTHTYIYAHMFMYADILVYVPRYLSTGSFTLGAVKLQPRRSVSTAMHVLLSSTEICILQVNML